MDGNRFLLAGIDFSRFFPAFYLVEVGQRCAFGKLLSLDVYSACVGDTNGDVVLGDNRLNGTNWDSWELTAGVQ